MSASEDRIRTEVEPRFRRRPWARIIALSVGAAALVTLLDATTDLLGYSRRVLGALTADSAEAVAVRVAESAVAPVRLQAAEAKTVAVEAKGAASTALDLARDTRLAQGVGLCAQAGGVPDLAFEVKCEWDDGGGSEPLDDVRALAKRVGAKLRRDADRRRRGRRTP
jgi:hypothetical protein